MNTNNNHDDKNIIREELKMIPVFHAMQEATLNKAREQVTNLRLITKQDNIIIVLGIITILTAVTSFAVTWQFSPLFAPLYPHQSFWVKEITRDVIWLITAILCLYKFKYAAIVYCPNSLVKTMHFSARLLVKHAHVH